MGQHLVLHQFTHDHVTHEVVDNCLPQQNLFCNIVEACHCQKAIEKKKKKKQKEALVHIHILLFEPMICG